MDKMGFGTPEKVWRKEQLRTFVLEIISSPSFSVHPHWDAEAVTKNYVAFLEGRSAYSPEMWWIVCANLWLKKIFDNRATL
jgi:asparagine synthase (glutamine-hydrolysing)